LGKNDHLYPEDKGSTFFRNVCNIDQTTRRQNPKDSGCSVQIHLREKLQSHIFPGFPPASLNLACLLEIAFSIYVWFFLFVVCWSCRGYSTCWSQNRLPTVALVWPG
jgi:hypothetical protein